MKVNVAVDFFVILPECYLFCLRQNLTLAQAGLELVLVLAP